MRVTRVRLPAVFESWNLLGMLDLVVAVTTGFLTAPSLITPIEVHPSSELMTMLPMVMIPVYLVPLSIVLHIASLVKLHREQVCAAGCKEDGPRRCVTAALIHTAPTSSMDVGVLVLLQI